MLEIANLFVAIGGKPILRGIDPIRAVGEIDALIRDRTAPASPPWATCSPAVEDYEIDGLTVRFDGRDL